MRIAQGRYRVSVGAGVAGLGVGRVQQKGIADRRSLFANVGVALRDPRMDSYDANSFSDNSQTPYEMRRVASAELSYLSRKGDKATVRVRYNGSKLLDFPGLGGRPLFPSQVYVDLLLAHEPSLHGELFFNVTNVFNRPAVLYIFHPSQSRQVQAGFTRRF